MKALSLLAVALLSTASANAQAPLPAARTARPNGMVVPMMSDAQMRGTPATGQGQLVFNNDEHGFYYFDGTDWQPLLMAVPGKDGEGMQWTTQRTGGNTNGAAKLSSGTSGFWDLTGNAATDPATDFIGTTDFQPLKLRVNNTAAGTLSFNNNGLVSYGIGAGAANTGTLNTFIGGNCGNQNTSGQANTFFGALSGQSNTTGLNNTFIGSQSGGSNNTGNGNTFMGSLSGNGNTTGGGNTAMGTQAGKSNSTGQQNTYIGSGSGLNCTASFNAFLGAGTGTAITTGGSNTLIGNNAGASTTTGAGNVCIGANAGQTAVLDLNNTLIGSNTDIFLPNITNATAIGTRATVSASNSLVLGSVAGANGATTTVNVGIGVINPADRLHVAGNIRMVDGNQAAGKVLTSDANGTGTWQALPAVAASWGRNGNAGTNPATDFIGTTDAVDFRVRTGNTTRINVTSAGKVCIGNTTPNTTLQVSGGFSIESAAPLSLGGASSVTVGDKSFIRAQALLTTAALTLSDGNTIGQILLLQNSGGPSAQNLTIADSPASSNCELVAARTLGPNDTITLLWNGADWIEVAFSNN